MKPFEWCICSHSKEAHEMAMKPACAVLLHKRTKLTADRCWCQEYQRDNLKYIEDLSRG